MSLAVVLVRTLDIVNLASVVRAMKNFGLRDLRLVAPAEYDPHRIEGIAHKTGDVLKRVQFFDDLGDAVADCTHVAGMTARERTAKRNVQRPREAAAELWASAAHGRAAVVLGPEDRGLTNEELDRCHRSVVIPTNRAHSSLNLSHAFAIMAYELYVAQGGVAFKPPRRAAAAATQAQLEEAFRAARLALDAIDFFKTKNPGPVMRTVREVTHRVPLDAREARLLQAMCYEVVNFLERRAAR